MKVTCLQSDLKKALSMVEHTVPGRTTLPGCSNILIETDGSRLRLSATNLERAVTTYTGCKVEEEGAVCVPAALLVPTVANMPDDGMEIQCASAYKLLLNSGTSRATIHGIDPKDFPPIPKVEGQGIAVSSEVLRTALQHTVFAAAKESSRPILTTVNFHFSDGSLTLVSADGYRLAIATIPGITSDPGELLVPRETCSELLRILPDNEDMVIISFKLGTVKFSWQDTEVISQLMQGTFPNYPTLIPTAHQGAITVNRLALLQAVKAAAIYAEESSGAIRYEAKDGTLTVSAIAQERGDTDSRIACVLEGQSGKFAIASPFVMELLGALTEDRVRLEFNASASPVKVLPEGNAHYIHILMPLFVQW